MPRLRRTEGDVMTWARHLDEMDRLRRENADLRRRIRLARKLAPLIGWGRTADDLLEALDPRRPPPKAPKRAGRRRGRKAT